MKHHPAASHYQKIVYWSDADDCFVGRCPGLFLGGVHGTDEALVYGDLCAAVDEHLRILDRDGIEPPPVTDKNFSGTLALRIPPDLHRTLAARAAVSGDSLNRYIERQLTETVRSQPSRGKRGSKERMKKR